MVIADGIVADLVKRIQNTRRELLDLSSRNRLISTSRKASQGKKIEIVDERSEEIFRILVRERKAMSFLSGIDEPDEGTTGEAESTLLTQPDELSTGDGTPDARHVDLRLQTRLSSERLQGRLLSIYYDAQTYEQEQGVSILYLAKGGSEGKLVRRARIDLSRASIKKRLKKHGCSVPEWPALSDGRSGTGRDENFVGKHNGFCNTMERLRGDGATKRNVNNVECPLIFVEHTKSTRTGKKLPLLK